MINETLLTNPNIKAFLLTIRYSEGTSGPNGYVTMFTGKLFNNNFVDHPRQIQVANGLRSDAAGAYQFMSFTWDGLKKQFNPPLPDFSPQSQDLACLELISEHNALNNVYLGQFNTAVGKLNTTWASLPGSPYGQPTHPISILQNYFTQNGGVITDMPSA